MDGCVAHQAGQWRRKNRSGVGETANLGLSHVAVKVPRTHPSDVSGTLKLRRGLI